jgi:hypothetical protein
MVNIIKIFNISIKEFLILFLLGLPIGATIFFFQNRQYIFEAEILGGRAVVEKFCNTYNPGQNYPLVNNGILNYMQKQLEIENLYNNSRSYKTYLDYDISSGKYRIRSKGFLKDGLHVEEFNNIADQIEKYESGYFDQFFKKIIADCNGKDLQLFSKIEPKRMHIEYVKKRYKKLHIYINSISPFLLLYLIFISSRYLKIVLKDKE